MSSSPGVNFVGQIKKKEREDFSKLENVDHRDSITRKMTV